MASLTVTLKGKVMKEIVIPKGSEFTIGRDKANMLVLDNPAVSRFHARVRKEGWPFYVEDLKSTNGTLLNNKPLKPKASLTNNDRITIGKFELIFRDEGSDYADGAGADGTSTIAVTRK